MNAGRVVVRAGLLAGALDLLYITGYYAIAFKGVGPVAILQGIAAGAIGRDAARAGGYATAALGLGFHFVIALGAAAAFYALSRKRVFPVQRPLVAGPLFGVVVWLFINLVVLPLSATPPRRFPSGPWVVVLIAHVTCVGLPIALVVRRAGRPQLA